MADPVFSSPWRCRGARVLVALATALTASAGHAGFLTFEAAGATAAAITASRDAFRLAVGGGTVGGANGSFGGLRREINWDGVPDNLADPNALPANFFNTTSPRGVVFSTPGTGFMVSANAGQAVPPLFGFPSEFQAFSAQRIFTAVGSPITDISFFVPGTTTAATTSAFGLVFTDIEAANISGIELFDASNTLLFSRSALVAGNQGLTFLGAVADAGERIGRVRITSGRRTILANGVLGGNPADDVVAMDDFLYAEPVARAAAAVPEPGSLALAALGIALALAGCRRRAVPV